MSTQLHTYDTVSPRAWSELASLAEPRVAKAPRGLSRRALNRACSYIAENLGERFTLDDLARQAGVSRFHFARLFRVSMGESPMAYLLKSRIERAKQMLLQDDRPVCEIAAALGFCDQSHLTRTFRRLTGLTPREFARQQALTEHQPMRQGIAAAVARKSREVGKDPQ